MSTHLTAGQLAWLESLLQERLAGLDQQLSRQLGGQSRAEHQHELVTADNEAPREHAAELEIEMALADRELAEAGHLADALRRLHRPGYGQCADCGEAIPFDRLKAEPWAQRCTGCESAREVQARR